MATSQKVRNNPRAQRRSCSGLILLGFLIAYLSVHQFVATTIHIRSQEAARLSEPSSLSEEAVNIPTGRSQHEKSELQRAKRLRNIPLRQDNNSTFSACLLVMDDNHRLVEWIAYHFQTLPLRYLVVAVDPRSKTSPTVILDRWERHMSIVRWSDVQFLPDRWLNSIPAEDDPTALLMKHRERQRHFYPACFELLQQAGREWTMVVDVDEFARQNPHWVGRSAKRYRHYTPTLLESIHRAPPPYCLSNTTCISIPRIRFGNFENHTEIVSSSALVATPTTIDHLGIPPQRFATLRWKWRAGLHSKPDNKHPKSMIHLQRIAAITQNNGTLFSRQDTDAHRPVRSACPRRNLYILNRESPWSIHHYVGSVQEFTFRKDARDGTQNRNADKLDEYAKLRQYDNSMCGGEGASGVGEQPSCWLTQLVRDWGVEQSRQWLEGVGNVNVSYSPIVASRNG